MTSVMQSANSLSGNYNQNSSTYSSRQKRFGPAPLASFEDLPTDEQCSSEDEKIHSASMACPLISFLLTSDHQNETNTEAIVTSQIVHENVLNVTATNEPNSLSSSKIAGKYLLISLYYFRIIFNVI